MADGPAPSNFRKEEVAKPVAVRPLEAPVLVLAEIVLALYLLRILPETLTAGLTAGTGSANRGDDVEAAA